MDKAFVVGAINAFLTGETGVYAIEGKATGFVTPGENLLLTDPGKDKDRVHRVTVTKVCLRRGEELEAVSKAGECNLLIYFECEDSLSLRNGVVVHSESATPEEIRKAYLNVLGNVFVVARDMDLNEKDYKNLELSDLAEIWMCFWRYQLNKSNKKDDGDKYPERLERLMDAVCTKLFELDGLNVVYSKRTNEPFMFNRIINHKDKAYSATMPDIMVLTEAVKNRVMAEFDPELYEVRHISKDNMVPFLGGCFYINGAAGVRINNTDVRIPAEMLVEKPEDDGTEAGNISNPDLVKWILLLNQMADAERNEESVAYGIYAGYMETELMKAKFLIPAKDEDGKLGVAAQNGRGERPAARLYTDWGKLRLLYDPSWACLVQTLEEAEVSYDAIINYTGENRMALYVSEDDFNRIKAGFAKK